jgi:hypothetical protein
VTSPKSTPRSRNSAYACCTGVLTAKVTNWCTFWISSVIAAGAATKPTFQPVV